jgi:histidyl-tRNA synthetase
MQQAQPNAPGLAPHAYLVMVGERAESVGLALAERVRDALPRLRLQVNLAGGNLKAQFRRADKSAAGVALILGDSEIERGVVAVKMLRVEAAQKDVPLAELPAMLGELLPKLQE